MSNPVEISNILTLKRRLEEQQSKGMTRMHITWGEDARQLSANEKAAIVLDILDHMETAEPLTEIDF